MKKKNFSNIAVIRDDRLGDTILTLPIMKKLKEDFPESRLTMIISKISRDLLQIIDFVDDFIVSNNSIETVNKINSKNFDLILNFSPLKGKTYKFFLKSKRKVNIIYLSRYKKKLSNHKLKLFFLNFFFHSNHLNYRGDFDNLSHQTIYMNKILKLEGISLSDRPKRFNLKLNNDLKFDCLIHLSNKWINSEYFDQDLVSLLENISKKFGNISLTTDMTINDKMNNVLKNIKLNKKYYLNLKPDFKKWINLIDQSKLIITPECGCSHVCGLLNKKTIIIYDKRNKANYIKKEYHPYLAKKIIQINSGTGKALNEKILSYI